MEQSNPKMLSVKVRVLVGIFSIPSLFLLAMLIHTAMHGDSDTIGAFEIIYSIVGIVAMYMAVSGRRLF